MSARDSRSRPWLWLGLDAMETIRNGCPSAQIASVRNVYMALAESATRAFDPNHASFKTTRAEIAHLAGVSTKTVDRGCTILEELGLLEMLPQTDEDGRTLPSVYRMVSGGDTESPPLGRKADTESPPNARTRHGGKKEERSSTDARTNELKFCGKIVPTDVAESSQAALARWNQRTGQSLKPLTARGKMTPSLSVIVGTMLDYPEAITIWPCMIEAALRRPWWTDSSPTPGVVFGANVRERMIEAAKRMGGNNVVPISRSGPSESDVLGASMAAAAERNRRTQEELDRREAEREHRSAV